MRRFPVSSEPPPLRAAHGDWRTIKSLLSYLLAYKWWVALALSFLIAVKVVNLGVPMVVKRLIDAMSVSPSDPRALLIVPVGIVIGYGLLRLSTSLFSELRGILFAKVTESSVHTLALQVFRHLHALSLHFHLERQTGGMSHGIERGTCGIQSLILYSLYSILPTLVEIGLVITYFFVRYDMWFAFTTFCMLVSYIVLTVTVTSWCTHLRRKMNELDSRASQKTIDSPLSLETAKYSGNKDHEVRRYDEDLKHYCTAAIRPQNSLSVLNLSQQFIVATALIPILYRATQDVAAGHMTLDDLILVNTLMLQIYIPLNFLGVTYHELKQAVTDMDCMFDLLQTSREVTDRSDAPPLMVHAGEVCFTYVDFSYEASRQILSDVNFTILAGMTTTVVRQSGSDKLALARLLFRLYDMESDAIQIDGQDLRDVTQSSVHATIDIAPQDTVLFNDSIYCNIACDCPGASCEEVTEAVRTAQIRHFVEPLPDGYETQIGEYGLKLSDGEKQRVTITCILLKRPPTLVFDEAMSALNSRTEHAIQEELVCLAQDRITLVVAHRLSTIVRAHRILAIEHGRIIEWGTHESLLHAEGRYTQMRRMQARESERAAKEAEDVRAG